MRYSRFMLLFALLPTLAWGRNQSIYVCAHPDDCLLFMNPNLYDDVVKDAGKVVVIYLTSGDAGQPFSQDDNSYPLVRERASIDATEWMVDVNKNPIRGMQENESVMVNTHPVTRVNYGNSVSYFMRLPDGNFDGNGFEHYSHQSLRKLKSGEARDVATIDGGTNYADWQDVLGTLSEIVTRETEGDQKITLHISEPDIAQNIHDHSDHTTGASGVMDMLAQRKDDADDRCYTIYKHIDYSIAEKPENLTSMPLVNKAGGFAVLTATQRHFLEAHNWDEAHLSYITRNYYTVETLPQGCDQSSPSH